MAVFPKFPKDDFDHSSTDVGQSLAGLIARDANGLPRVGFISAPTVAPVSGAWKVRVGRCVYVSHSSGAVQFSGLSGSEDVTVGSSAGIPSGQSRIDLIVWDTSLERLVVVPGTAATSPSAPSAGGRAPVARVTVAAGDAQVTRVTPVFVRSALAGVQSGGTFKGSADTGYLSVPHGMNPKPEYAVVTPRTGSGHGAGFWASQKLRPTMWDINDTHIIVRYVREDSNEWLMDASMPGLVVDWVAGY